MFNFQFDIFNSVTRLSWKFGLISPTLNLSLVYEFDLFLLYFFKKTFQFYFVVVWTSADLVKPDLDSSFVC